MIELEVTMPPWRDWLVIERHGETTTSVGVVTQNPRTGERSRDPEAGITIEDCHLDAFIEALRTVATESKASP